MKVTKYPLFTSKNIFFSEKNFICNLMIKGGLIRKLSSGIYVLLPNGINIINNIISLIKKYMNKIYAFEISMPILQSSKFWKKSGRIDSYGNELFKIYDRNQKLFILSPTHEEVITNLICNENFNFSFFPKIFYQIQSKFRDEIRPKLGINRSREFIMKDAYSFHKSIKCLDNIYEILFYTYKKIFNKIGLNVFYKESECGNIGGFLSHEFYVLSNYGDNYLNINNKNKYFFFNKIKKKININNKTLKLINIHNLSNLKKLYNFLDVKLLISTYLVKLKDKNKEFFLLILLPSNKIIKISKLINIYPLVNKINILSSKKILKIFNFESIFLGPFGFKYKIIADYSLINFNNFIVGANKSNYFYINVNFFSHISICNFYDICENININLDLFINFNKNNINKNNKLSFNEVGHIFKLSDHYTKIFSNVKKNENKIFMGCYGIGITRILFSIVENYNDKNGIIWPMSITYFKLAIVPVDMYKYYFVYNLSFKIYYFLKENNINVLFDDRKIYIGTMLTDMDLIGIPNILIISNKNLSFGLVEFKDRLNKNTKFINKNNIFNFLLLKYKKII